MAVIKVRRKVKGGHPNSDPKGASGEAPVKKIKRDICVLCDDGGDLLCCDGGCRRSFHPTKEHGEDSMCTTLGLTEEQWQTHVALGDKDLYICKNCEYKQHQCFACGLLGSSDLTSGPEVFQCSQPRCGHFYHPNCVAKLLYPDEPLYPDDKKRAVCEQRVADRRGFFCPLHLCKECEEQENKDDKEMQLAVCRRCPTAYHRKCLPSDISFEEIEEIDIPKRAWEKVLPKKILIYCTKHEIDPELETPKRDHIVFPDARNASAAKRARGAPQRHGILEEDELLDRPSSSEPSQSPRPAETGHRRVMPIDSFAPKHLFLRPQPGSCGWLDE